MTAYQRRPLIVEARQWNGSELDADALLAWIRENGGEVGDHRQCCSMMYLKVLKSTKPITPTMWVTRELAIGGGIRFDVYPNEAFQADFQSIEFQAEQGGAITDVAGFDLSWCTDPTDRNFVNELLGLEIVSTDDRVDGDSWMFKPYPISTLGKLVSIILEDITLTDEEFAESGHRPKFLEVGCGVGTKLTMVSKLFGLDVTGFDYNEVYCQAAIDLLTAKGCTNWHVTRRDALEVYAEYQEADIIYLNRPFVHLLKQEALERLVFAAMHRGAYVILGNYASTPEGWQQIAEDKVAAVFRKPL